MEKVFIVRAFVDKLFVLELVSKGVNSTRNDHEADDGGFEAAGYFNHGMILY